MINTQQRDLLSARTYHQRTLSARKRIVNRLKGFQHGLVPQGEIKL